MAVLFSIMQWIEFHFWLKELPSELLILALAILFLVLGIWLGVSWQSKPTYENRSSRHNPIQEISLSKREMEVLQLIALGKSNLEIAEELYISIHTVKSHVSNLFQKLDVKRRTQAIRKAQQYSILPGTKV